jgi:AraC-like DNA-binding protein/quercetin dioxygenase-like cupin family protein
MYVQKACSTIETGDKARPRYLGEKVSSLSGQSNGWHSHDFGQLISSASGSLFIGTSTHTLLLSPAMVLWIPPDAEHWMRTSVHNEMLYADVNRDEAGKLGTHCRVIAMTPLLRALMNATLPEQTALRAQQHIDKLHDLLRAELIAAKDVPLSIVMPQDKRIRGLAQLALDDPATIHSVDTWLEGAAASRKTVERLFVAETGMPPSRWLRQARILHAVSQLAAGEKVSSVAYDSGYGSSSAFSYMFRRAIGLSPSFFCR